MNINFNILTKIKKRLSFCLKNERGFSLMEIIISIGIITVGVVTILNLFSSNLKIEIRNKNKIIAIYLAQEQIEVIRQIRDTNWFNGNDNWDGININGQDTVVTLINQNDIRDGWKIIDASSNTSYKKVYLYKNASTVMLNENFYIQDSSPDSGWIETNFERYLVIKNNAGGCEPGSKCLEIVSHVSYRGTELAQITAYIYGDWY